MNVTPGIIRRALLIFLPLAAAATVILFLLYRAQFEASWTVTQASQEKVIEVAREVIQAELQSANSDVLFLSELELLQQWLVSGSVEARERLARSYLAFASHKMIYDQVRLIDLDGQEIVRVDWNNGKPSIVGDDQLQNKSDRYYVRETLELPRGVIFRSSFDLNVERGVIEQPLKPTTRFGTPVFDAEGRKRGMVMVNHLGIRLLEHLRVLSGDKSGNIFLLNADGYWLLGPKAEDEWGFMFPERKSHSFANLYPQAWDRIRQAILPSQFVAEGDLFAYQWVLPRERVGNIFDSNNRWILLGHFSAAALAAQTATLDRTSAITAALLILLLAVSSWIVARHQIVRQEQNQRLARNNAELESLNKELEAFSYSVSHDLRAPLRAIDGFSQALLSDSAERLDENGKKDLGRIRNAAQRMGMLIDDLIKLARVTRTELRVEDIDLSDVAGEIVDELKQTAPQRQGEFMIAPKLHTRGDPRLMRIALENLLNNAWKFTAERKPARIEFGRTDQNGGSAYYVRDNGAGFDMAYAGKLFGAFQRLHDAREFAGTGIGLATVQRIIRKHGGHIWADSQPDKGATFYFTL